MTRQGEAAAVLALSAGTLAFEVLLVRVFAIEQFHHFAAMVVGVAMLGVGAGGTWFALAGARGKARVERWFFPAALSTAVALVLAPVLAELIRVDPTALVWNPAQWPRLAALYLVLGAPFACSALATLAALARPRPDEPSGPGLIYGASLSGAGLGSAIGLGSLWIFPPLAATGIPGVLAGLGAMLAARSAPRRGPAIILAGLTAAASILWMARAPSPVILQYKSLPQTLAFPDARIVAERTSPLGWILAVAAPAFRYSPGLSLAYRGVEPDQIAVFSDAELAATVGRWSGENAALLQWQPSAIPWAPGNRERVLVLGGNTPWEVAVALRHGAAHVTAVEPDPAVIDLAQARSTWPGRANAQVTWIAGDPRAMVARLAPRFDLVSASLLAAGGPGGSLGSLAEDYHHTVEAYSQYLNLLQPGGILAVTAWLEEPPRSAVRVILTAADALRRSHPGSVTRGLVVMRSWNTATLLVKPDGFADGEVEAIERWASERWFDLDWPAGPPAAESRFNLVERRSLLEAARAAATGAEAERRFMAGYPFDVRPATDVRPYPHHYLGLESLAWLLQRPRGDWLAFADWGHLALLATLAQGSVLAALLMLVPAWTRAGRPAGGHRLRLLGYFAAIGCGYLAAEIGAMQQLTLLLGHPVYAVAAVLSGVLVVSGVGSVVSDRVNTSRVRGVLVVLALVIVIYTVGLLPAVHLLQPAPLALRVGSSLLALTPMALLMGVPFPSGLRALAGPDPGRVAWAWAANGFASVIMAPVAALMALEWGTRSVFGLAAAAYAAAAVLGRWK